MHRDYSGAECISHSIRYIGKLQGIWPEAEIALRYMSRFTASELLRPLALVLIGACLPNRQERHACQEIT